MAPIHAVRASFTGLIIAVGVAFSTGNPASAQDSFSPGQEAEIQQMIHDYIMDNPEVVLEALRAMEQRHRDEASARQRDALTGMQDRLYNDDRSIAVGPSDPNAAQPVTMVEFFDYQCGYCKRVFPSVMKAIEDDPGLKVIFVELPVLGPISVFAARAALAAKKQDAYFDFHRAVMNERGGLSEERVMAIAESLGMDRTQLRADMDDPAVKKHIQDNLELAQALGIRGTPAMVIGSELIPGAVELDRLKEIIAKTRAEQG